MLSPSILLSLVLGALYGTVFHLWRGQTFQDLFIYLLAGIIGFGLGQVLAKLIGLNFFLIGPLHLIEATTMSWLSLFLAQWLKIK